MDPHTKRRSTKIAGPRPGEELTNKEAAALGWYELVAARGNGGRMMVFFLFSLFSMGTFAALMGLAVSCQFTLFAGAFAFPSHMGDESNPGSRSGLQKFLRGRSCGAKQKLRPAK